MIKNELKAKLAEGKTVFGTYVHIISTVVVEALGIAGLDFARFDPYHAPYDHGTLAEMVRAAYGFHLTPWARVREEPWEIMIALDVGVQIVTVPDVATVDDAKRLAEAAHYPPHGKRENMRPLVHRFTDSAEYFRWAENEIMTCVQIESVEGVQNAAKIAAVEGIDVIATGRGDLSNSMGLRGQPLHPKVLEAEERIVEAGLAAGKHVSMHAFMEPAGIEHMRKWIARGVQIWTLDIDVTMLIRAFKNVLPELRGMPLGKRGG